MDKTFLNGRNVIVMGLGRFGGGVDCAVFAAKSANKVIVTDLADEKKLADSIKPLITIDNIELHLGGHREEDFAEADIIIINPAVSPDNKFLQIAKDNKKLITSQVEIFFQLCSAPIIGITGSNGKSTTAALTAHLLKAGQKKVWLSGNIGNRPLLEILNTITAKDLVVLELSSFQLEQLARVKKSPNISVITNLTPNHLDRHNTMEAYISAKTNILTNQNRSDIAVLGLDNPITRKLANDVPGRLVTFSIQKPPQGCPGTWVNDGNLYINTGQDSIEIMPRSDIPLRGDHNLLNVLAACAVAYSGDFYTAEIPDVVRNFSGVEHRLEFVRSLNGASWYNDSIATAPERTTAAIQSFKEPLILLLGGRDKNLPWQNLAKLVHHRVDHVVLFGEAANIIKDAIDEPPGNDQTHEKAQRPYSLTCCNQLEEAVKTAAKITCPGDVVLLSPGGTSYDEFKDFEERGKCFKQWVQNLS